MPVINAVIAILKNYTKYSSFENKPKTIHIQRSFTFLNHNSPSQFEFVDSTDTDRHTDYSAPNGVTNGNHSKSIMIDIRRSRMKLL